jgi:putative sigma-54 modulation protein
MNRKAKALEFANAGYNIQITGRHIEVTDSMKDYAMEKLSKIERFMNRIIDVAVIVDIQKLDHRVEMILKAGNLKLTSSASSTDMYASIDKAVNKLEHQILRYKSKMQDHHLKNNVDKNNVDLQMLVNVIRPLDEEEFEETDHQNVDLFKPHQVVDQEMRQVSTLNYEAAIMKMEFSNDPFLIFKNQANQKLTILYRREDGNYGIIEPS